MRYVSSLRNWLGPVAIAAVAIASLGNVPVAAEPTTDVAAFQRDVLPVLTERCIDCHGPKTQEADLRIDTLDPDLLNGKDAEIWHDVLNKLNLGEMPPEEAEQLAKSQRKALVNWLTEELQRVVDVRRSTGGQVVLRRLTRYEYNYTMQDLLGVEMDFAKDLPPDSTSADGFQNEGGTLSISPLQVELYLDAARRGLTRAIVTGEQPKVFTHRAEKSEKVRRVKGEVSNQLGYNDRFLARMNEFPREGEVAVRVTASAIPAKDAPLPRMRVTMGVRADVRAPEMTLAEIDVDATEDDPQAYEFRGRIEDFPLPGHNPKYPGLQITIYNIPPDGSKGKKEEQSKLAVHLVEFEGPIFESWPPPSHQRLLPSANDERDEAQRAREALRPFLARAYRRPASDADVAVLMNLFEHVRANHASFEEAMREVMAMALISPEFLYLVEPKQDTERREPLTDYELATRLSYFLWCSMPDDRLFELAAKDKLRTPAVLAAEVKRMLADSRSQRFVEHFTDQWFDLSAMDRVAVNPEYHPNFDDRLKDDMRTETQLLFATILNDDLSCMRLLDADFTFVNQRLANHYGLDGPRGSEFERVSLSAEDRRGGVLTHGSFLLANSNGEDSHPIKRAVWLLDRLLDSPPAPPPPDVPDLDPQQKDLAGLSLKQQLEAHRQKEACNNCHRGIDPWGVALENYDAVGRWREEVTIHQGKKRTTSPVDSDVTLPDGASIEGITGLKSYLLDEKRDQFAEATVRRLLTYALGRSLDISDDAHVDALTEEFAKDNYRLGGLIAAIVQSEPFQTK